MKTRLSRILPGDLGFFLGFTGFVASIPIVIFAFTSIGPGRTVHLNGFFTLTFTGSLNPIGLVLAYPFLNALAGVIAGFLIAWLYNFSAQIFRGVSVDLNQDRNQRRQGPDLENRPEYPGGIELS